MVNPNMSSHFVNKCCWRRLSVLTKHSNVGEMHNTLLRPMSTNTLSACHERLFGNAEVLLFYLAFLTIFRIAESSAHINRFVGSTFTVYTGNGQNL